MLECFSGKRSTSNEGTLIESEERKSLISDTENEKGFSNKSEYNIVKLSPYGVLFFFKCMKPYGEMQDIFKIGKSLLFTRLHYLYLSTSYKDTLYHKL